MDAQDIKLVINALYQVKPIIERPDNPEAVIVEHCVWNSAVYSIVGAICTQNPYLDERNLLDFFFNYDRVKSLPGLERTFHVRSLPGPIQPGYNPMEDPASSYPKSSNPKSKRA